MSEFLGQMKRTNYCTEVSEEQIGQEVVVMGWTAKTRNLGSLSFYRPSRQNGYSSD